MNATKGRIVSFGGRKYGNKPTQVDGVKFPSIREANRYKQLKLLERAGRVRKLELQPEYRLEVAGVLICKYRADFRYEEFDHGAWTPVVEDTKGFQTPSYKLKKKLVRAVHGVEIRET